MEKVYSTEEYYEKEIKPKQLIEIEIAKLLGLNVLGWAADEGLIYAQEEYERGDWCLSPVYLGRCVCELFDKNPDTFHKVPKFLGHSGSCMEEVPHYARDMDSTMLVLAAIDEELCITIKKTKASPFVVSIYEDSDPVIVSFTASDASLPLAICKCFLEYSNGK